jgi:spermidine/putrescine transport system permease protein
MTRQPPAPLSARSAKQKSMRRTRLTWKHRFLAIHAWAVYLFLYGPIAILVAFSFNRSRNVSTWEGFSWRWYAALFEADDMRAAIATSLAVGALATGFATVFGTLAAMAMGRGEFRGKPATAALLYLPIIIPEIVLGAALLTFFAVARWHLSLWTIVIAHVMFSVSYVAIVVRARLAGFDRSLKEAAMDLGAGRLGTFGRVTLPLMMPGIVAGALLVFTLSIDDYVITSFVAGPESMTLPMLIASKVKLKSDLPVVNAAATLLLAFTIVLILVSQRLVGERRK